MDLVYLRERITAVEEMNDQARQAIEKLDEIVEKLRSPAFRVGTFLIAGRKRQGARVHQRHGLRVPRGP